jgi:hypothetical protein
VSGYRTPGEAIPDGPAPLAKGPAMSCAGCGAKAVPNRVDVSHREEGSYRWVDMGRHERSPLPSPRACTPYARVVVGVVARVVRRRVLWLWTRETQVKDEILCAIPGSHLHERCKVCGLEWLTAFAERT